MTAKSVLAILRNRGEQGINSADLNRIVGGNASRYVYRLKKKGFAISARLQKDSSIHYVLEDEKPQIQSVANKKYVYEFRGNTAIRREV